MATHSPRATGLEPNEPGGPKENMFRVSEHVRTTHSADGAIVLDILHGQMFRLNFIGSRILELLKENPAASAIAEQLAREFGIDTTTAEADVRDFVATLEQHHLAVSSPESE